MKNDYATRQSAKDAEYQREYRKWIESLSPSEQQRLVDQGLGQPYQSKTNGAVGLQDIADSPAASYEPDLASKLDAEQTNEESLRSDTLASFCSRIRSCSNPMLVFDAVCFATGVLALEGKSQTELAKKHGVSKAAFSKLSVQWCNTFGLKPSRGMKSEKARQRYSKLTRSKWYERHRHQSRRAN